MEGHKIYARHSRVNASNKLKVTQIKSCIRRVLSSEGVDKPCEVNVLITDDDTIRDINQSFRGINKPTDVLSFPMHEFAPPGWTDPGSGAADPETGLVALGEIVISAARVREQACEYGHSVDRETAYLTVHSVLHLLGYDHEDEAEGKKEMRSREETIMREIWSRE